ncbi:MAG: hypothetical protein UU71_C0016G0014 [Parcubacteria group bacterium GW2011_GWB1_41_6]|nr:MAG: hypothetical protein UU71_C0016G0014 [Parcubacteria group bacterium GW2011_GWB1_41_6]KKS33637.1 MAG: hypothetical protein UU96_C0018G0007 [Parcubacteria group bacterium GW2011_GWC2_42_13]KKS56380.1 MAG: hypothetical protein UV22_C0033G0008 [Parcubacteria group bacterium GW2011_GWA2_42_35]KKS70341.1 MAG: hypothetical protein UV43_C0067G0007 [Parcubacteria group bacterium GW2011_GWF2_42_7]
MEKIIGLKELRQNVSGYAQKIKKGQSFVVVKRSKPLFKVGPIIESEEWEEVVDFTKIKGGGVNIKEVLSCL